MFIIKRNLGSISTNSTCLIIKAPTVRYLKYLHPYDYKQLYHVEIQINEKALIKK